MIETYKIITKKEKVNPDKFFQMIPDPEFVGPRTRNKKIYKKICKKGSKEVLLYHEGH